MAQLTQPPAASGVLTQTAIGAHAFSWIETTSGEALGLLLLSSPFTPIHSADGMRAKVDSASAASLLAAGYRLSGNQADG